MCLKMRTEDQLHCVSLTIPFRGAITVLEVESLGIKKRKVSLSTVLYKSGVLGSPWIFFIRPRRSQGFTDKKISVHLGLFPSLNGTDERSRYREKPSVFVYFVIKMSELEKRLAERQIRGISRLIN